ncbi:hypothetical protein [Synechococcus sp. PCC 6312]|uniref:hypothetical protein n=1 Tax=Synechococcus sp. (strain ATCC 27167 / PCC 6312) TaxID=195253 RepID=UPI001C1185FA|nr:hypothetical protein [Synechococcus sp. PCC 6312]
MAYDNLCKSLVESNPRPLVTRLLVEPVAEIKILKTELRQSPVGVNPSCNSSPLRLTTIIECIPVLSSLSYSYLE